jgi:hypothetical protein
MIAKASEMLLKTFRSVMLRQNRGVKRKDATGRNSCTGNLIQGYGIYQLLEIQDPEMD